VLVEPIAHVLTKCGIDLRWDLLGGSAALYPFRQLGLGGGPIR